MRRVYLFVVPVLAAVIGLAGVSRASAQETKTAKGTVASLAADSVTVKVGATDMKFMVDPKTEITATGAGTKAAAAKKEGMAGPKLSEVVKTGQAVEVKYKDMGGTLHASSVRAIPDVGSSGGGVKVPTKHSTGTVKSISGTSLVITSGGKDTTFSVDGDTHLVAPGAGTKAAAGGGKLTLTDGVHTGDHVSVSYHDMGGTLHASTVRVTAKASK
jgi:hypothetical protein